MADMDSRQKELLDQFINVTDVDQERAKFYLESAAWDLQVALAGFYDEEGDDDIQEIASISREVGPPPTASNEPKVLNEEQQEPQQTSKNASKYATIFGVNDGHESDEEEGQAFYAGGSERSGQQILGPKKKSKNDFVGDMFKAAKDLGAEVVDPEVREDVSRRPATFQGAGYRLGDNDDDDIEIISASTSGGASKVVKPKKDIVLKMWKGGFSVDNAIEQRAYDDPTNRDFLESIRRGEIPVELIREARGGEVSLTMEDHRNEDFEAPRNNLRVFSGKGHMLGSPAPSNWTNTNQPSTPDESKSSDSPSNSIRLDESQPVTTIQIRLADGSRLIAKLNHHHTVGDLRQYITIARPQFQAVTFTLMTTFPNRELVDDKKTIKDENLLNAVVMQKMI